jgi:hypothetical protein
MSPDALDDGVIVWAPSMLVEGKSVGTAHKADLILAKHLLAPHNVPVEDHAKKIKIGVTVGRKKLREVMDRAQRLFAGQYANYTAGRLTPDALRASVLETMREAWRDAFMAGIRAAGVPGSERGSGKLHIPDVLPAADELWLKSAMAHETTYLNRFLTALVEDTTTMPPLRRIGMYVDALGSFYESGRLIGLPESVLLWWAGPNDKRSCAGCRFLHEQGPYTKFTLPTTPRAGLTPCLTHCRDRILVRRAGIEEVAATAKAARYTREGFIAALRRIKKTGKMPT